ncbi:MAG: hypothetical protein IKE23_01640, partial [Exiguobacterium sp.]|nr:hypothetical protein [Exiguobacterium sp.]
MLDPEYILKISEGAEEIAGELSSALLSQVIKRLLIRMKSEDEIIFSSADKYALKTLQDAGILLKDITKIIAKYTNKERSEIRRAYEDAGIKAVKNDNDLYRLAGISPTVLKQSPHLIRLLQRNYEATMGEWDNYTRTTAEVYQQSFIQACDSVYLQVATGGVGYSSALMDAVARMVSQDVKSVIYTRPDGTISQTASIEVATLRAVRTGVNQACAQITGFTAHDHGIYQFLTSAHYGARPTHAVWQGKVFWVDWDELRRRTGINYGKAIPVPDEIKAKYDEFCASTDIGSVTGLCGANCRHSYSPFIEGLDYSPFPPIDAKENAKDYELSQKQRALERAIRKQKKTLNAWETAHQYAPDEKTSEEWKKEHAKQVVKLQKLNKGYREFCQKNGLKPQEFRLFVG